MQEYVCYIWLGLFGLNAPENYFVQEYNEDEVPTSQFGREQNQPYFDYDFVEITFLNNTKTILELVQGHSYSESYIKVVMQKAEELGVIEANVFVLANKDEFESPQSVRGSGYDLWYLGEFVCEE